MSKREKAQRAIAIIEELRGEVELCPDWETVPMRILEKVERMELKYYKAFNTTIQYLSQI